MAQHFTLDMIAKKAVALQMNQSVLYSIPGGRQCALVLNQTSPLLIYTVWLIIIKESKDLDNDYTLLDRFKK
jgi:hypothetical protein